MVDKYSSTLIFKTWGQKALACPASQARFQRTQASTNVLSASCGKLSGWNALNMLASPRKELRWAYKRRRHFRAHDRCMPKLLWTFHTSSGAKDRAHALDPSSFFAHACLLAIPVPELGEDAGLLSTSRAELRGMGGRKRVGLGHSDRCDADIAFLGTRLCHDQRSLVIWACALQRGQRRQGRKRQS